MRKTIETCTAKPPLTPERVNEELARAVRLCGEAMCQNAEELVGSWRKNRPVEPLEIHISADADFIPKIRVVQELFPF